MTEKVPRPPPPLAQPIRLILALSALCATHHPSSAATPNSREWYTKTSTTWVQSICKLLEIDTNRLPPTIDPSAVSSSAADQLDEWSQDERVRIAGILVEASLASTQVPSKKKEEQKLSYTPLSRAWSYRTLELLGLPAKELIPAAEKNLSETLFAALKAAAESETSEKVESTRAAHSQGWGGSFGRHLATGAGVIAGGVLIGVTGGLAAPAIAALLAPLGIGGLLAGGAAPVVLGTLFGVGGGGLAGRRVRERWKGVEEFGFVEVGAGTKATREEIEDLREARKRLRQKEEDAEKKKEEEKQAEGEKKGTTENASTTAETEDVAEVKATQVKEKEVGGTENTVEEVPEEQAAEAVDAQRSELEERLLNLSLEAGTRSSISESPRTSTDSSRPRLDDVKEEEDVKDKKKPPSLTATIVVPGLLTVSKTEAITAWRSICSSATPTAGAVGHGYVPRVKDAEGEKSANELQDAVVQPESQTEPVKSGFKDGRDVYLLRFETERMLKTGRDIDLWVGTKLKGKLKAEIIKRTVLNAYFAAVKLPMTVYSMASMSMDNTWMQAQDRAKKAGRILGEVLEKRVQGERPVVLIGSSVGAYTVLEALLYLSSLPPPQGSEGVVPSYVESAYLISLPSAPTPDEWAKCRGVVARRLVNAWSGSDFVLAGVCRLHEVLSRAATLNSGLQPAGLGSVNQPGVQDVDVSKVLRGHMELQAKMGEVIRIIDIDA